MQKQFTFVVLLGVLVAPGAASAYTLRTTDAGRPVRWADAAVSFRVNTSLGDVGAPDQVARTVVEALAGWGDLPASPFFFDGDPRPVSNHSPSSMDGVTDIVLVEHDWQFEDDYAGVTLVSYDVASGVIRDADIYLNGVDQDFEVEATGDAYDVGNVLTHELGHLLGMGHSEATDATMFAMSRPGETGKRTLSQDDAAGFEELYGDFAGTTGAAPSCSMTPQAPGSAAVFTTMLVIILLLVNRARGRRPVPVRRIAAALAVGLVVLFVGTSTGRAFEHRYRPAEELARSADVILLGTVQSRHAHWAGRIIVTDVTVSVDECWVGDCGSRSRVVRELGGEVGEYGMLAPEPSALPVGARALLFARESGAVTERLLVVVDGRQGVFTLDTARRLHRDLTASPDRPSPALEEILDLRSLRAVILSALEAQRTNR